LSWRSTGSIPINMPVLISQNVYGPRNEGRRKRTRVRAIAVKIIVGFYQAELARASNRQPQGLRART
jgi:hypothetical protein